MDQFELWVGERENERSEMTANQRVGDLPTPTYHHIECYDRFGNAVGSFYNGDRDRVLAALKEQTLFEGGKLLRPVRTHVPRVTALGRIFELNEKQIRGRFVVWFGVKIQGNGYTGMDMMIHDGYYFEDHRDAVEFRLRHG